MVISKCRVSRREKGFALLELMIAVAIIGILAAIALPAYARYVARAKVAEAFSLTDGLRAEVAENWISKSIVPGALDTLGVAGKYVSSVQYFAASTMNGQVTVGRLVANFGPAAGSELNGHFVSWYGGPSGSFTVNEDGSVTFRNSTTAASYPWIWQCVRDDALSPDLVPTQCR